jgi:pimeloyl-ACP methyl ester carboxylesterase
MSAILLDREIVHYEVLGRGRPVLFLHDWVGSWRYWIPAMQAASISFRAYALDFWGFGDSAKTPAHYYVQEQARLLEAFLDELGIGRIALVGHGLGAIIALLYTRGSLARVDRVMSVSLPLDSTAIHPRLGSDPPQELADWLLGRLPGGEAVRAEAPKTDPLAVIQSLASLDRVDLAVLPASLPVPCLLVHGLNDPVIASPTPEEEFPERVHQVALDGSGHYPMLDQSSKFNRLLADFLNLEPGVSPCQLQLKEEWKRRVR